MSKFHINDQGEPGKCSAQAGNCPFGSEDKHFSTQEDARKAYELSQEVLSSATHRREKIAFTQDTYRDIFHQNSIYKWSSIAINVPADWADDTIGGVNPNKAGNMYHAMAANLKNNSLQLAKYRSDDEIADVQSVINKIADSARSRSKNRAYAALVLTSHLRQDFTNFDLPRLDTAREELIAHWNATKEPGTAGPLSYGRNERKGPRYLMSGSNHHWLNAHSVEDLETAQAIAERDYSTWTKDDKARLDAITSEQLDAQSGLMQRSSRKSTSPWTGFVNELHYPDVVDTLRKQIRESLEFKKAQAKESELLGRIFKK